MASPESIHHLLIVAARLLDRAAQEIRDAKLEPVRDNIEHIGRALAEVFDVHRQIYALRPQLKPAYLTEPSPHPEADKLLTRALFDASMLEEAGRAEDAIKQIESFLTLELPPLHRNIAEGEIGRLRGE
jgi:Protein of unknown function (DUF2379)